jgi:hypothetical protein
MGYCALEREPVVFQVHDFGDRFWVYPIYDARSEQFSRIGKAYGTKPGFYLVAGPNWAGDLPKGCNALVRSASGSSSTCAPEVDAGLGAKLSESAALLSHRRR